MPCIRHTCHNRESPFALWLALLQAENSYLAAKFSGRWDHTHKVQHGHVFLDFDPYCFKKILSYLQSRSIEEPDHPAASPVIAAEHEAQFNQLVLHLLLEDFVGLCGMRFLAESINEHVRVLDNGTALRFDAPSGAVGMALLAPAMQSGEPYYLRCKIQCKGTGTGDHLLLGVTSRSCPTMSRIHKEDAGWSGPWRGLNDTTWSTIPHWLGWQEAEQYLFKVDLLANILTVQISESQQVFRINIHRAPTCPMFFFMSCGMLGTIVKLLPVLSQDIQDFEGV